MEVLKSTTSIKLHVDRIYDLRMQLDSLLSDEEKDNLSSMIKSRVQSEAEQAFYQSGEWGAIYGATGSGKSKIALDIGVALSKRTTGKFLLSVPTEKLRDDNWKDEFTKWGAEDVWNTRLERCCYASLNKYENQEFEYVILDEGHNITDLNSEFFEKNKVHRLIFLTATKPKDPVKLDIMKDLKIYSVYEISLDDSVKLGLVAPYDITVINMTLDNTKKYIKAGNKLKTWYNTEKAHYGFLSAVLSASPNAMGFIKRMQFIYNLQSKTEVAKLILENVIPKDLRTVIFCGSKEQANILCEHRFYSKPSPPKKLGEKATPKKIEKYNLDLQKYQIALMQYQGSESLDAFIRGDINRISCCEALNEGHNLPYPDVGFIVQVNSNDKDLIQRIGRIIRYRPGHTGKIIILCVSDSEDKNWVKKALGSLDTANIRYVELSHLRVGLEKINFD
jgi:superfamily II DNA or RNA helicase